MIRKAVRALERGGVVAFPTETVYGLGGRLFSPEAIRKIYSVKGRPQDNPLIVHISHADELNALALEVPPLARKLAQKFWPGPLTLVVKKSALVPKTVTAGLDTVAVRMPRHPVALELLRALGEPIAAPSANRSGRPSPTCRADAERELKGRVSVILDGGSSEAGLESTVVDATGSPFRILRPGCVTLEELRRVAPVLGPSSALAKEAARSPGLKHRHYQPACKVVLVAPGKWAATLRKLIGSGQKLGVISVTRKIPQGRGIVLRKSFAGARERLAHELYSLFFEAEKRKVKTLVIESTDKKGVGLALMDRLTRASS